MRVRVGALLGGTPSGRHRGCFPGTSDRGALLPRPSAAPSHPSPRTSVVISTGSTWWWASDPTARSSDGRLRGAFQRRTHPSSVSCAGNLKLVLKKGCFFKGRELSLKERSWARGGMSCASCPLGRRAGAGITARP